MTELPRGNGVYSKISGSFPIIIFISQDMIDYGLLLQPSSSRTNKAEKTEFILYIRLIIKHSYVPCIYYGMEILFVLNLKFLNDPIVSLEAYVWFSMIVLW